MLKRTLFFTNPYYLSVKDKQLIIQSKTDDDKKTCPIEDLGFIILDHQQISFSQRLLQELCENNVAVIFCNMKHEPYGMILNLESHHLQTEHFNHQIKATEPLKKNLWKQIITAKIKNQSNLLKKLGKNDSLLNPHIKEVLSGDSTNREAVASRIYWQELFADINFKRGREEAYPNNLLNYGYAILRAAVSRALTGSGLLPTIGIHHHNRYNSFCLSDDIMEPYRPFIDEKVVELYYNDNNNEKALNLEKKQELLKILTTDVYFNKIKRPLMIGLSQTTASLARCFEGKSKRIAYPYLQ